MIHFLGQPLLWTLTISFAAPITLAALGGTLSERGGVVNIAMEGMMLLSAFTGTLVVSEATNGAHWSPQVAVPLGIGTAVLAGVVSAAILAAACVRLQANQIIVGMAINVVALGLTTYFLDTVFGAAGESLNLPGVPPAPIPFADHLSLFDLGNVLFRQNPFVYLAIVLTPITYAILFRTNLGLRLRACGENPFAAEAAGLNVRRLRYAGIVASGSLCGIAGADLCMASVGGAGASTFFGYNMTEGLGFIALAAVVVGRWNPIGAAVACFVFAFGEVAPTQLINSSIGDVHVSGFILNMLPYVLTLILAAGLMGRATPPAADGQPYEPQTGPL
jgi:ABC-type uncharacterized transport system permease subunit